MKRGRPSQIDNGLFKQDVEIANAVYWATFETGDYKNKGLNAGVEMARRFGRKISSSGVEKIVRRLLDAPVRLYPEMPDKMLRARLVTAAKWRHGTGFFAKKRIAIFDTFKNTWLSQGYNPRSRPTAKIKKTIQAEEPFIPESDPDETDNHEPRLWRKT